MPGDLRSVATAMNLTLGEVHGVAESSFDARGTLGLDREVPVGIGPVTLTFTVATDADDAALERLADLDGAVLRRRGSLREAPTVVVRRA